MNEESQGLRGRAALFWRFVYQTLATWIGNRRTAKVEGPLDNLALRKARIFVDHVTEPARLTEAVRQFAPELPDAMAENFGVNLSRRLRAAAKVLLE